MHHIVLLNDIFTHTSEHSQEVDVRRITPKNVDSWSFWSRYLGPYAAKQAIENKCPGKRVLVLDYFTKIPNFFDYIANIVNAETEYIGISTTFLHNNANARVNDFNLWMTDHQSLLDWFSKLKSLAPNAKIIIGGHKCDVWYQNYVVANPNAKLPEAMDKYVDCIIHGYAESSLPAYINNTLDPSHVVYRNKVAFVSDGVKAGDDKAECLQVQWNESDAVQPGEWLPLEVSKGCRFGCKFCMYDKLGTTIKSKECLRAELISNYEKYGVTGYLITDDTINDSMHKVTMMHEVFTNLPFKVEWIAYCRVDMFHKFPEMLDMMLESGCRGLFLGIETLSKTAGRIAGKGLDPEKVKSLIHWLKEKTGDTVFITASFIIGLVGETEQSLEETLQYLKTQKDIDRILFEVLYIRPAGYRTSEKNDFFNNSGGFGIKNLRYYPYYWEHDTLNFNQCVEIHKRWMNELAEHEYSSFWSYPRIRSLGYTHDEAFAILKTSTILEGLYDKNQHWVKTYHDMILKIASTKDN